MMEFPAKESNEGYPDKKALYRSLSLVELVERIVDQEDPEALEELHTHRTVFTYRKSAPLLFVDFLEKLKEYASSLQWMELNAIEIAETAYDLTLDKFSNMPGASDVGAAPEKNVKRKEIDCRYYFKAFLEKAHRFLNAHPEASEIRKEAACATILKGLVRRHFYLSFRESLRRNDLFWSRYCWRIGDICLYVWLPVTLEGRERKKWLEENVPLPDPYRPGERERVQEIINEKLIRQRLIPLSEAMEMQETEEKPLWGDTREDFQQALARTVAEEKVERMGHQRRAIQQLGAENLKGMILRIFEKMEAGSIKDVVIAREFGLTKSTYSRFAGSRWDEHAGDVPDLWLNTAQVLSTHSAFKEVVVSTGMLEKIETKIRKSN